MTRRHRRLRARARALRRKYERRDGRWWRLWFYAGLRDAAKPATQPQAAT